MRVVHPQQKGRVQEVLIRMCTQIPICNGDLIVVEETLLFFARQQ